MVDNNINQNHHITLKKLQRQSIIPNVEPIKLKTDNLIYYPTSLPITKVLVISNKNTIGYCKFSKLGKPQDAQGVIIFPDGAYYLGSVIHGKIAGRGKLYNQIQMYFYEGQWLNGIPQGYGQETICGNLYKGSFKNGKKDGNGILKYSDGTIYQGAFKANQITGYGKYITLQCQSEGSWKSGYLEGNGFQLIQSNNQGIKKQSTYNGYFVNGQRQGYGKFQWDNNRQYQGTFKQGQLHGEGILRLGPRQYRGVWQKGTDLHMKQILSGASVIQFKRV